MQITATHIHTLNINTKQAESNHTLSYLIPLLVQYTNTLLRNLRIQFIINYVSYSL